jgi:phosphoribosyl-AMP cyclohydrolase / phosphoribosyl-ATP pyrophosphohydrolase
MAKASGARGTVSVPAPGPRAPQAGAFEAGDVAWGPDGLVPAIVQDARDGAVLMLAWMDREALEATHATGLVHFHSRSRGRLWQKGETSGNVLRLDRMALDCDRDTILVIAQATGPTCHTGRRSCFDGPPSPAAPGAEGGESSAAPTASPPAAQGFASLETLWNTITERRDAADPAASYTARLLAGGVDACARKVTEEATEVLLAARDDAEAERSGRTAGAARDGGAGADAGSGSVRAASEAIPAPVGAIPHVPVARRAALRAALAGEVADLAYHLLVLCAERGLEPAEVIAVLESRRRG